MSRARKRPGVGDALAASSGCGAPPPPPPVVMAEPAGEPDPASEEIARLRTELADARTAHADANRLLAEVKAQRNAAMDEIMLLRAQLKIAVDDGNAGWAAASAARGQTH